MSVQTTLDAGSGARQGQADPDRCALALLGLNRDITFHRKHKLPNEAQPQARATLVTAFVTAVRPREPVEDLVPERGGDARTFINHEYLCPVPSPLNADSDDLPRV